MTIFYSIAFVFLGLLCSCGPIDPEPLKDDDGNEITLPEAYDHFLTIEEVTPASEEKVALRPTLWIRFSDYLDDDVWLDQRTISLVSGGTRNWGFVTHVFSRRAVLFRPHRNLLEGLTYTLDVRKSVFYSSNNAPLATIPTFTFTAEPNIVNNDVILPTPSWAEIRTIFEQKCNSCHQDPKWGLNHLEYDSLVGKKSEQVDRFLVRPFDSAHSYLVQKILPGFDEREFTIQPPPWSGAAPLNEDEILAIDRWVALGAKK